MQKVKDSYEVVLSDPMRMNPNVTFSIALEEGLVVSSMDPEISVVNDGENWEITANTSAKNGQSAKVTFDIK